MAIRRGVGLVLTLIGLAVVVSLVGLALTLLLVGRAPTIAANGALVLGITGSLEEVEPSSLLSPLVQAPPTVRTVTSQLRKAKTDARIKGVIIEPRGMQGLWAKIQEVRDAIVDFRSSGKPIVALLEYGGTQEYVLASACDKVFLMPSSPLDLTGLASYEIFFRGTLDKIGTYPDLLHIGDYKTAANTFTETGFTPAHREMAESLNGDLFDQLVQAIAEGRGKTDAEIRALIDNGPFLSEDAIGAGLIDDVAYEDEVQEKAGFPADLTRVDGDDYALVSGDSFGFDDGERIALLYGIGTIASGNSESALSGSSVLGSDTFVKYVRKIREDDGIKALVLRIDSPGGSGVASDVMWRELMLLREKKPIIASMSDVAASGGYYIAMPAHAIVAQPGTLTGSIGVVMGKFATGGTLGKLGMNIEAVSQGAFAEINSPMRPYTPEERAKLDVQMQAFYNQFVEKVAAARQTTPERIDAVARGRVWTGRQAKQVGLVDELGGLSRAIELAKVRAGIAPDADVDLVVYPPRKTFFDVLSEALGGDSSSLAMQAASREERRLIRSLTVPMRLLERREPLALMPNVLLR